MSSVFPDKMQVFINGSEFCCCTGIEAVINPLEPVLVKLCFEADKVVWDGDRIEIYDEVLGESLG